MEIQTEIIENAKIYLVKNAHNKIRHFIIIVFIPFNKSACHAEYYLFSEKLKNIIKEEFLFVQNKNRDDITFKSFERFVKEKAIDDMNSLVFNQNDIKKYINIFDENYLIEIDFEEYNYLLKESCKEILTYINTKTNSQTLRNKLYDIIGSRDKISIKEL